MVTDSIIIKQVQTHKDVDSFIALPWRIYRFNPLWVPPLRRDLRLMFNPELNPFYEHGAIETFIAWQNGQPVGRIAGILDKAYSDHHKEPMAFFGFFECLNIPPVGKALLNHIKAWALEKGFPTIRGPFNPSANHTCGLLIKGFDQPPALMMPYNPPFYVEMLNACGLEICKLLPAYELRRSPSAGKTINLLQQMHQRVKARLPGLKIRPGDINQLDREVAILRDLYNEAWSDNWGFVPITPKEAELLAKTIKPIADPRLIKVAEIDSHPVGMVLGLPDYNQVLRKIRSGRLTPLNLVRFLNNRRKIDKVRVLLMGVKPKHRQQGVDVALMSELGQELFDSDYQSMEMSWVLEENNLMHRLIARIGGEPYKHYGLFEGPTDDNCN